MLRGTALGLLVCLTMIVVSVGCSLRGSHDNGVGVAPAVEPVPEGAVTTVRMAIEFSPQASATVEPVIRVPKTATETGVIFRLKVVNVGNLASPSYTLERFVPVRDGQTASATFPAIPLTTVLCEVEGVNTNVIAGYRRFHGAADLVNLPLNVITVSPVGSGWRHDLAAHMVQHALVTPTLFARLRTPFATLAHGLYYNLSRQSPTLQADAIAYFTRMINPPSWRVSIAEVRQAQASAGLVLGTTIGASAAWIVGDNYVTNTYGSEDLAGLCGVQSLVGLDPPPANVVRFKSRPGFKAPARWSWLDQNGRNFLPPVRNQGIYSTCIAFALCTTLEAMMNIEANVSGVSLSQWHLFAAGTQRNSANLLGGWAFPAALEQLKVSGTVAESVCPYYLIPGYVEPGSADRRHRLAGYEIVSGAEAMKEALASGPLVTSMRVYEDFVRYNGGIYRNVTGRLVGNHAIVVVGYDDALGCWICRNSWSQDWGESGNFRIVYSQIQHTGYRLRYAFATRVPDPPVTVAAVPSDRQVRLTWDNVAGASKYNVYWSESPTVNRQNGRLVPNVASPFTHTGLANLHTYYYVVTCETDTGESPESPVVAAMPVDAAAIVPANFRVVSDDAVNVVSWDPVEGAVGYDLFWSTTTGVTPGNGTKIASATSPFSHVGLNNGTNYHYVVTARVGQVESLPAAQVSGTPRYQPPAPPVIAAAQAGNRTVTVSWNAVASATSYRLYYGTSIGIATSTATLLGAVTSPYTHTGCNNGTTYYYILTTHNDAGESAPSPVASATPMLPVPGVVTVSAGQGLCTVGWAPVPGATSYSVHWSTNPGVGRLAGNHVANLVNSPHTVSGLANGVTHYFTVTAVDATTETSESPEVSATPRLTRPTGITATAGDRQVTLTFPAVPNATHNLFWSTTANVATATANRIDNVTSPYVHTARTNGATTYYVLTASDSTEQTLPTTETSATPHVTAPGQPRVCAGPSAIRVKWDPVANAGGGYRVYYATAPGVNRQTGTHADVSTNEYVHTGLASGATYYFVVTARDGADESSESPVVSTTPATDQLVDLGGGVSLRMIELKPGWFDMGSGYGGPEERPVHRVTMARRVLLGETEVRQDQYQQVTSTNPSFAVHADWPVDRVTWLDAVTFCNTLSAQQSLAACYTIDGATVTCNFAANGYRLPTEAEWEYAARAGGADEFSWGPTASGTYMWYDANSGGLGHPVFSRSSIISGFYGMHGSNHEWCWDWYDSPYPAGAQTDPTGPAGPLANRMCRGGSMIDDGYYCRSAVRTGFAPTYSSTNIGFRVARTVP